MLSSCQLIHIERDFAVHVSSAEDAPQAIDLFLSSMPTPSTDMGIAIRVRDPAGPISACRGAQGERCLEYLRLNAGKGERDGRLIHFGDSPCCEGEVCLIAEGVSDAPSVYCSLERRCQILAENLKRISATKNLRENLKHEQLRVREAQHRFRNYAQLGMALLQDLIDAELPDGLEYARKISTRLSALITIQEMMNWDEEAEQLDARDYFIALARTLRPIIPDGNANITCEFSPDFEGFIRVRHATAIGLICNELMVNSCKHTTRRPLHLRISLAREGNRMLLRYTDLGFKAEDVAEPMAPTYPTKKAGGTGSSIISSLARRIGAIERTGAAAPWLFELQLPLC